MKFIKKYLKKGVAFAMAGILMLGSVSTTAFAQINLETGHFPVTEKEGEKYKWLEDSSHHFSSFSENKENAFEVDVSYGFKFIKTENTEFKVTKGKASAYPTALDDMEDTNKSVFGPDTDWKWFKTNENSVNNIQVKWTNLKIYQCETDGSNGRWEKVDVVRTVTGIEKYNGQNSVSYTDSKGDAKSIDCYITLGPGLTSTAYVGVEEVKVKNEFFKAGTNTKITLKSNQTLTDIDSGQYVGLKSDKIDGEYVAKDSMLYYKNDNGTSVYYFPTLINLSSRAETAAGFIFEGNSFDYTFGRVMKNDKGEKIAPSEQAQYIGTGQNMVKFPTPDPTKTVSDNNEINVTDNRISHPADTWTYTVEQVIPTNVPANFYYDDFRFYDEIEPCMKIQSVKVYGENASGTVKNVTDWFDISTENNMVTANLKDPKDADFYKRAVYRMEVKVKLDVPADATEEEMEQLYSKWKQHGHYDEWNNEVVLYNSAGTTIDGKNKPTNEVKTTFIPNWKGVSDEKYQTQVSIHDNLRSLTDKWTWTIHQPIDVNPEEGKRYDSFVFKDDLEECQSIQSVKVFDDKNNDVTDKYTVTTDNNQVRASLTNPKDASFYGSEYYECRIQVKMAIPDDPTEEQLEELRAKWKSHGHYTEDEKIIKEDNIAKVEINGVNELTGKPDVDTDLSTDQEENPGLAITKDVNLYEHQVGDTVKYTVKVWNTNPEADTAKFIIKDTSLPDTVKLDFGSVKVDGISSDNYILEQKGNGWEVRAKGDYALPYGTTITITYDVTPLKASNGTLVNNTATAIAAGVPQKSDSEQIYINSPKTDVVKTAPNRKYKVGDTVGYRVEITNRNPGTFMRDINLHDIVETPGLEIKEGSVAVLVGGKDVTSKMDVTYAENGKGFDIITPYNLKNGELPVLTDKCTNPQPYTSIKNWTDKIVVTYDATITDEAAVEQDLKNTFTVPATKNTNGDIIRDDPDIPSGGGQDDEQIQMKPPTVKIDKESDEKKYSVNDTGTYTLTIHQTKEELVARNIFVEDKFEQREGFELDTESITVTLNKKDITDDCTINKTDEGGFRIETGKNMDDEDEMVITYKVKFTKSGTYKNTSISGSDNTLTDEDSNTVIVEEETPVLKIKKKSDKKEYNVGDTGVYTLDVSQIRKNATAKNVVISDAFEQKEGLSIDVASIKVFFNEEDITSSCKITPDAATFKIETGKDMTEADKIKVTYNVAFTAEGQYDNTAVADADNTDEVDDDNTVTVKEITPVPDIKKVSDKKEYKVGDTGVYILDIAQTVAGATARNVVITDAFEQKEGLSIDAASIKVFFNNEDITSSCKITPDATTFNIETGKDMTEADKIKVTYNVTFAAEGKFKNIAVVKTDNTPDGSADNEVDVKKNDVNVYKNADKKSYKVGEYINYNVAVSLKKENSISKNVAIEDNLPSGTKLDKDSVKVEGITNFTTEINGNSLKIIIPELKYGEKVTVTYRAKVLSGTEGKTLTNKATVNGDTINPGSAEAKITVKKNQTPKTKTPATPVGTSGGSYAPKTGDYANMAPYAVVVALAGIAAVLVVLRRRKLKK